jgi:hypothetical protein
MTAPRHESLEAAFFAAVAPRPAPWGKRTLLWLLPALLAFGPVRVLFLLLRGRGAEKRPHD